MAAQHQVNSIPYCWVFLHESVVVSLPAVLGTVGIPLIAVAVVLVVLVIAIPATLLCLFKYRELQRTQQQQSTTKQPASFTPCAAYGITTHKAATEAEYETIELGGDTADPTLVGGEPEYEIIPETLSPIPANQA